MLVSNKQNWAKTMTKKKQGVAPLKTGKTKTIQCLAKSLETKMGPEINNKQKIA